MNEKEKIKYHGEQVNMYRRWADEETEQMNTHYFATGGEPMYHNSQAEYHAKKAKRYRWNAHAHAEMMNEIKGKIEMAEAHEAEEN